MKKIFFFFLIIAVAVSCSNNGGKEKKRTSGFELKGKFSNTNHETVFLEELSPNGSAIIDSAVLNDNGEFNFLNASPGMGFYNVRLSKTSFATLILDSTQKIFLEGDAKNLGNTYKAEGSPDTKLFLEMNKHSMVYYIKLDSIKKRAQAFMTTHKMNDKRQDSLQNAVGKIIDEANIKHLDYVKGFISEHSSSLVSLIAIQQLPPEAFFEDYFHLDSIISSKLPGSTQVKYFHENVMKLRQQIEIGKGLAIGSVAPEIALNTPDGKQLSLSSTRGKVILVDFWASWCGPCRAENPNVVRAYNKYKNKGFDIFGVSLDQDKGKWIAAIQKDNLTWNHVSDLGGWQSSVVPLYKFGGIPTNYLLDKSGKIIASNLRGEALEKKLAEVLK